MHPKHPNLVPLLTALAAAAMLAACGGDDNTTTSSGNTGNTGTNGGTTQTVSGVVGGAAVKNPTGVANSSAAGVDYAKSSTGDAVDQTFVPVTYANATVCADTNGNGACDSGEAATRTDANGRFTLITPAASLVAVVGTDASYVDPVAGNTKVASKMILRSAAEQATADTDVVISPLSTEVVRLTEAESLKFADAKTAIASRLSFAGGTADVTVKADDVVAQPGSLSDTAAARALLVEDNTLAARYTQAATILDRGYVSDSATDPVTTLKAAQDAAFNPEGIPRYDHLFVVIFENHSNQTIDNAAYPNFYKYLHTEGNKAANYFSTGNPSEPNYISLASADDWGVADDNAWNCLPAGDTANQPTDVYVPVTACNADTRVHNLKGRRNMFTAMYKAGMGTRVYSESMNPGQDPRRDGVANASISGPNPSTGVAETMPAGLYKTKHHPAVNFDDVRNRPDFFKNLNRSVGGGQWDASIVSYAATNNITWNTHQFEDDLKSGDIGALNYIVPDQCDDIHGVGPCLSTNIARGDAYAKYLVDQIQASPAWKNTSRRSAIVMLFDEGSSFFGSSSCCGWNVGGGATSGWPLGEGISTAVPRYNGGNKGDGPTIFALLTNQPGAPKQVVDSDAYSHFSFVRTMQDMFGLADPAVPASYMNRSKYTEQYIADNLANLAEYSGSANTHFDSVRPMNHKYVVKAGDLQSGGSVAGGSGSGSVGSGNNVATGPDTSQVNIWAIKS
ncbi:alkaline phosphatase family protein [Cupriavidus pauculus]|uniref:alkaline phosphatase family protein n=1 Tax=Cupriavidus pauculus TaxID=82633 RepID=UPI001EE1F9EC|nr:alkaline phosphatase family protein [Cupriavidus pauculus]GJG93060.1 phosphoesterase [Cupriavidus pauculus]